MSSNSVTVTLLAILFVMPLMGAKTPGIFRGVLMEIPQGEPTTGFVYLRARNGNMRKVEIAKAVIAYDASVPKEQQTTAPSDALKPGADVRITAEQEGDGEWHASRIDIMGSQTMKQQMSTDDDDDDDGYTIDPYGSTRPVIRKG